ALPGLDRPAAQRAGLIRDDEAVVDADGAPEAAAGVARPERRVEGELAGGRLAVGEVALGAVQVARVAPGVGHLRGLTLCEQARPRPTRSAASSDSSTRPRSAPPTRRRSWITSSTTGGAGCALRFLPRAAGAGAGAAAAAVS